MSAEKVNKKKQKDGQNSRASIFNKMKNLYRDTQKCELSIRKLNLIERCISEDSQYMVINLLKYDRYEELSINEIYDELYQNFHREVAVAPQYKYFVRIRILKRQNYRERYKNSWHHLKSKARTAKNLSLGTLYLIILNPTHGNVDISQHSATKQNYPLISSCNFY